MSERREGYVTHDNLWSNQAYDLHGDKTRIHVREVLPGDIEIINDNDLPMLTDQESDAMNEVHKDWDAFFRWRAANRDNQERDDLKDRLPIVYNGKTVEELAQQVAEQARQLVHARGVINALADRLALANGTTVPHEIHAAECEMELAALTESELSDEAT
jgi:uncharacterized coiled-coil protein SlyX